MEWKIVMLTSIATRSTQFSSAHFILAACETDRVQLSSRRSFKFNKRLFENSFSDFVRCAMIAHRWRVSRKSFSLSRNHNFQLVCCRIAFRCICFHVSILHNDSICFQCRSQLNMLSWVRFSSAWILIECRFVQLPSITPSDRKRNDSRRKFCTTLQILTPLSGDNWKVFGDGNSELARRQRDGKFSSRFISKFNSLDPSKLFSQSF